MKIKISISFILLLFFVSVYAEGKDVITQDGGVAASWVMTGAFIIIGALISFIIFDMKRQFTTAMKSILHQLSKIQDEIKEHDVLHGRHDEKFKTIFKELNQ